MMFARGGSIAVMALLRRDLLAGGRAASVRIARLAAIVLSGGAVLVAYATTRAGYAGEAALTATVGIFGALSLIATLSVPQAAIQALRREREAGMLDLLLMAGLTPSRLALGRMLSTFVNLLSILLATLPALALLAFFGRPTPTELIACIGIEACAWLALAGFAVAVSAWAPSTATAALVAIGGLIAWLMMLGVAAYKGVWLSAGALLREALGYAGTPGTDRARLALYIALHLGIALLGWGIATVGIRRVGSGAIPLGGFSARPPVPAPRARAARRPSWLARLAARPPPLRDAWPLTWLLQRRAAGARPRTLALLLLIPPLALTWKGEEGLLIAAWCLTALAILMALLVPSFQVSAACERHQWESLIGTALDGRRAVLDLVRGALTASAVPAAAVVLSVLLIGLHRTNASMVVRSAATCAALVVSWFAAALLGTTAGLVARSTAGAVRLCGWLALLVGGGPFLVFGCAFLFEERALDEYSFMYGIVVALLAALSILGLRWLRPRNGGRASLVFVPVAWAFIVAPLFMVGDVDKGPFFAAGGLGGLAFITWEVAAPGYLSLPVLPMLLALPHAILAAMLLSALMRRADRWLGRPA